MDFKMDHIVINAVDIESSLNFYTNLLDLPGERIEEFKNNQVPFPSVRITADTIIDLFPKNMWEKTNPESVCRPNLNHFCLSTDKTSWELLQKRLTENGIPLDDGPVKRWGARGSGISVYFRDPDNNVIEVRYYESEEADMPCMLKS